MTQPSTDFHAKALEFEIGAFGDPEKTYIAELTYYEQEQLGCFIGTVYNATDERWEVLEGGDECFVTMWADEASRWWNRIGERA
jgi:hypothetical protein